jgi:hypothetical protein
MPVGSQWQAAQGGAYPSSGPSVAAVEEGKLNAVRRVLTELSGLRSAAYSQCEVGHCRKPDFIL